MIAETNQGTECWLLKFGQKNTWYLMEYYEMKKADSQKKNGLEYILKIILKIFIHFDINTILICDVLIKLYETFPYAHIHFLFTCNI